MKKKFIAKLLHILFYTVETKILMYGVWPTTFKLTGREKWSIFCVR